MIRIERTSVMNLENAIRGARNPLNSWGRMDSAYDEEGNYVLGPNDLDLATRLARAGSDHRKYLRMVFVSVDITAPLYWWKEFDTYKVGTVANSCSTMHKIHAKPFERDDFSHDRLDEAGVVMRTEYHVRADLCGLLGTELGIAARDGHHGAGMYVPQVADGLARFAPALGRNSAGVDDDRIRDLAGRNALMPAFPKHDLHRLGLVLVDLAAKSRYNIVHIESPYERVNIVDCESRQQVWLNSPKGIKICF